MNQLSCPAVTEVPAKATVYVRSSFFANDADDEKRSGRSRRERKTARALAAMSLPPSVKSAAKSLADANETMSRS